MAARRLGLAAFMALAARGLGPLYESPHPRPTGTLVWVHVSAPEKRLAAEQLAEQLTAQDDRIHTLITGAGPELSDLAPIPDETTASCTTFLNHWQPDLCLWVGGDLRPCLLALAHERAIPMVLIDPRRDKMSSTSRFWTRLLAPVILSQFTAILTDSPDTAQTLVRKGAARDGVTNAGAFVDGSRLLPFDATRRNELSEKLHNRSLWMAAGIRPSELSTVLSAHQRVLQFALRSILIVSPDDPADADEFYDQILASTMRVIRACDGEDPAETTQVILADCPELLGVWYRLTSVCFLGASLRMGMPGQDPNTPAGHGAAIVSGPYTAQYQSTYDRYLAADAVRITGNETDLAAAIKDLISPDKSANMALAAWDVASQGAQVMDKIIELSLDLLETSEAL